MSSDIRFTTKGDTLYAIALGWSSNGKILIKALVENAPNHPGEIRSRNVGSEIPVEVGAKLARPRNSSAGNGRMEVRIFVPNLSA